MEKRLGLQQPGKRFNGHISGEIGGTVHILLQQGIIPVAYFEDLPANDHTILLKCLKVAHEFTIYIILDKKCQAPAEKQ